MGGRRDRRDLLSRKWVTEGGERRRLMWLDPPKDVVILSLKLTTFSFLEERVPTGVSLHPNIFT